MEGYAHPAYAHTLTEYGRPRCLPRSGGWILERSIPGTVYRDAMGCYPLFACPNWSRLAEDLEELRGELVSVVLVTDPFGTYTPADLDAAFPGMVQPYKKHFVTDLTLPKEKIVSKNHRRHVRVALRAVRVRVCADPEAFADTWQRLYETLIERHRLCGIHTFSRSIFRRVLALPNVKVLYAESGGTVVGGQIWILGQNEAYSHLVASSHRGYELMAAYALHQYALEYFADKVRWLVLGAAAGAANCKDDGLAQFKRGWSTGTRVAYLCRRILDEALYRQLAAQRGQQTTSYFPAYRAGEFSR